MGKSEVRGMSEEVYAIIGKNNSDCGNLSKALKLINNGVNTYRKTNGDVDKTIKEIAKDVGVPFDVPIALPYGFFLVLGLKYQPEALAGKDVTLKKDKKRLSQDKYNKELTALHYFMKNGGCLVGHVYWGGDRTIPIGNLLITMGVNCTATFLQITDRAEFLEKTIIKNYQFSQVMTGQSGFMSGLVAAICGPAHCSTKWHPWGELYNTMLKMKEEKKFYETYIQGRENNIDTRVSYGVGTALGDVASGVTFGVVDSNKVRNAVMQKTTKKKYV